MKRKKKYVAKFLCYLYIFLSDIYLFFTYKNKLMSIFLLNFRLERKYLLMNHNWVISQNLNLALSHNRSHWAMRRYWNIIKHFLKVTTHAILIYYLYFFKYVIILMQYNSMEIPCVDVGFQTCCEDAACGDTINV